MNITEEFEEWMRKRHLKECVQCQKEGKARLMDSNHLAVLLFKEFYSQRE